MIRHVRRGVCRHGQRHRAPGRVTGHWTLRRRLTVTAMGLHRTVTGEDRSVVLDTSVTSTLKVLTVLALDVMTWPDIEVEAGPSTLPLTL